MSDFGIPEPWQDKWPTSNGRPMPAAWICVEGMGPYVCTYSDCRSGPDYREDVSVVYARCDSPDYPPLPLGWAAELYLPPESAKAVLLSAGHYTGKMLAGKPWLIWQSTVRSDVVCICNRFNVCEAYVKTQANGLAEIHKRVVEECERLKTVMQAFVDKRPVVHPILGSSEWLESKRRREEGAP